MSRPELTVHGVLGWHSDSQILTRLRPVFASLLADAATVRCDMEPTCREDQADHRGLWCAACRLQDVAERVQRATRGGSDRE